MRNVVIVYFLLYSGHYLIDDYKDAALIVSKSLSVRELREPEHSMLSLLCLASLALVQAGGLPRSDEGSGANWIDVCAYHDNFGERCCAPGMEDHRYMVLPQSNDWNSHLAQCE